MLSGAVNLLIEIRNENIFSHFKDLLIQNQNCRWGNHFSGPDDDRGSRQRIGTRANIAEPADGFRVKILRVNLR
jgi:hypothetical protein